ncbi:hypothetical protein [Parvibium lacunae]|uniref:Uncharacterized protein n=1 Tax=Parvibium lacunae TaxID=1888893 RepID=A0A368L074_9BURK|nr:hypothetical protein [Parvibium lacunae]RCS56961.1 hypothetical protein DU000_09115 [Parvibium lacunae]
MDFELLCVSLREATPSEKALKGLGLSDEDVQEFTSSFNIIPRDGGVSITNSMDVVKEFFTQYDPSNLEVGMIRFLSAPKTVEAGQIIGQVEADPLVVDKSSGKVFVADLTSPGNTLWECADSVEKFLLTLVPAANYLGQCLVDHTVRTNKALSKNTLDACVSIAGGNRYESFFRMILGIE